MCGRFALTTSAEDLLIHFGLAGPYEVEARTNVAPSQPVLAVRAGQGGRELTALRWGLVPGWARDPGVGARLINARAESAADKPAFRAALRARRCLVPASAFYEWRRVGKGRGEPWALRVKDTPCFALAALWEAWRDPCGAEIETCALLTTAPNAVVAPIHDRMPVILAPAAYARWLDPGVRDPAALTDLLGIYPADAMEAWRVDPRVGDPCCQDPDLLAPLPADASPPCQQSLL